MIKCSRKIHFCSGHRILNHESKCANVHGHNYIAWVEAEAQSEDNALDSLGRVIDFSVLKEKVGGWIDKNWDHTMIIYRKDTELVEMANLLSKNKPVFICDFNPTAENMADYILRVVGPQALTGTGVRLTKVVLYETENCYAEATL